jgi:hypothetical protein
MVVVQNVVARFVGDDVLKMFLSQWFDVFAG